MNIHNQNLCLDYLSTARQGIELAKFRIEEAERKIERVYKIIMDLPIPKEGGEDE